jgi:subtilisin-like proprotein convertase family protein
MVRCLVIALPIALVAGCAGIQEEPDTSPFDVPSDPSTDEPMDVPFDPLEEDAAADPGPDADAGEPTDAAGDPDADPGTDTAEEPDADAATDPLTGWGVPVCGTGTTIPDRGSYTDTVTVGGSLGTFYVMQLDIAIADRVILGIELPFEDLVVKLTNPTGVERTFWKNFYSDDVGGFVPDYGFPATWEFPVWWGTGVDGLWALEIDDTELTLRTTTLTSWCLTPIDPATHASHPIDATVRACATDTGSIADCDMTTPDCPGDTYFEMQVADIVRDTGTPTLDLTHTHPRTRELTIVLTSANGYEHTLWDRSSGTMPSSFTLTGMTGEWITGRYQLHVQDHEETRTGSITAWCLNAN